MRDDLEITIKNYNEKVTIKKQSKISDLIREDETNKYIAAKTNNLLTPISYTLKVNSEIEFITTDTIEGMEVYRRSLAFLLAKSVTDIYPEKRLIIMHSLGPGYYYEIEGSKITAEEIGSIEKHMRTKIRAKLPIIRGKISYKEAVNIFTKEGKDDKLKLIQTLNNPIVTCYECENFFEMVDSPLAPNTSMLEVFSLIEYAQGFLLQFPKRTDLTKPVPFIEQKKIFEVYKANKELGKALNADNVGALNKIIVDNKIKEFMQVEEALQEGQIMKIASDIHKKSNTVKLVTIAGPSSSGKTTFSKRLELQLRAHGLKPKTISVDNYFVDRDKTPLDEDGKYDYESLRALNLTLFNEHLKALLAGRKTVLAKYDFITGLSSLTNEKYQLNENEIVIIEGIHCLNEKLTYTIDRDCKYKIYISALTQMNIDNVNRIPTTDNRVIRRLVRDYKYRGHSAIKTLRMWPSVRRGEEQNIFPFQNDADGYFNSALDYELAVLKSYAEPILMQVKPDECEYSEAARLLKFLSYFLNVPADFVPPTSLLREFIGGSFFNY